MGTIYCAILSFANTKHEPEVQEIISSLLAIRNKLARSATMNSNVGYEVSALIFYAFISCELIGPDVVFLKRTLACR